MPLLYRITSRVPAARFAALMLALFVFACGGGDATGPEPTEAAPEPTVAPAEAESELAEPPRNWTVVSDDIGAELATPDIAIGDRRWAVVLYDDSGTVKFPVILTESYFYPEGFEGSAPREGPIQEVKARYHAFPLGTRGIYVTQLEFDRAGDWSVEASVPSPDGSPRLVEVRFPVFEQTESVDLGQRPPASMNRTVDDVESIAELTTGSQHDPELYSLTVAEALGESRPFVVVFASPAFCTNAVCGPQVEVASSLREKYGDRATFIHVDLYDNPHEIKGDLSLAVVSPLLEEWGLVSQEWTFVMDADGTVAARFENFVPEGELEAALQTILSSS